MTSSSAVFITLLGAASLIGCDTIIGKKGEGDGASATELAPPPAAAKLAQESANTPKAQGGPVGGAPVKPARADAKDDAAVAADDDEGGAAADDDEAGGAADNESGKDGKKKARPAGRGDDDDEADAAPPSKSKARGKQGRRAAGDDPPARDLGADLFVKRLVISTGVKNREPVGVGNAFSESQSDKIFAFVEVGNRDQVPSELYVTFMNKTTGKSRRVPLQVGAGARWRTWVFTRNATAGKWYAVVKNAKGKALASATFEITASSKSDTKADKAKADNAKADNAKADNAKADNAKADKAKADNAKADKSDPPKASDAKTGDDKTKSAKEGGDASPKDANAPKKSAPSTATPSADKSDKADTPNKAEAEKAPSKKP